MDMIWVWPTLLLAGVLLALAVVLWYARSMLNQNKNRDDYAVDLAKMAKYIKQAKAREQQAWNNAMTQADDQEILQTMYGEYQPQETKKATSTEDNDKAAVVLMQQAFFYILENS